MFPHEEFFDVLRLHAEALHRHFASLDCRDIGESAARLPNGVLTLPARWIILRAMLYRQVCSYWLK